MTLEMQEGPGESSICWETVETVLLDMDGTLLDLHFDDYFWLEHVPRRYGEVHGIAPDQARDRLLRTYRRYEGTLEWYSIDFWSEQLGLDVAALKEEVRHLVAEQPEVRSFLRALREGGKRAVLVTNAHGKSLALKMRETRLNEELDGVVCAHDLGLPKEDRGFWERLQSVEPFEPRTTVLIDDSLPVLRSAQAFGIRYLLAVERPNRRAPSRSVTEFPVLRSFGALAEELRRTTGVERR
ncbi:MAG: GMP/IMP nucleotidase [Acidobacteriota bacterium]